MQFPTQPARRALALAAAAALLPLSAQATVSVVGGLANFDVVNNTGREAYGFEIEFEDSSFYKGSVGSVFGLNRNFGAWGATGVVRFGTVDVSDYNDALGNHAGVRITYGGNFNSGITTPTNPGNFSTPGESCWPGAKGAAWTAAPCDHFGVTTAKNPSTTRYSWLVADPAKAAPQSFADYTHVLAGIPAVNIVYSPPQPAPVPAQPPAPAQVQVQIQAIAPARPADPVQLEAPEVEAQWGEAYWVRTFKTTVNKPIDLGNLLRDNADMDAAEVESEWSILQRRPLNKIGDGNGPGANEAKEKMDALGEADAGKAVMRRYEFYMYNGQFNVDGSGEVLCDSACENDPTGALHGGPNLVGSFVGAQMAGYNIQAAVPEPQTWALMLAGLAAVGSLARRQRR